MYHKRRHMHALKQHISFDGIFTNAPAAVLLLKGHKACVQLLSCCLWQVVQSILQGQDNTLNCH
jgi:hypothetical protein